MISITKNNLEEFKNDYHYFHDSTIEKIFYNIKDSSIEIFINVYWSGTPFLKEDGYYETHPVKMRMIFTDIKEYQNKEIESWDYIDEFFLEFITIKNKEYLCFADNKEESLFYVVCEKIAYEIVNL